MPSASRATALNINAVLVFGLVFVALGFLLNSAFFAVALGVVGASMAARQGNKILAYSISALAIALLLLQLGYGIGKDMAHGDTALQASGSTAGA